MFLDGNGVDRMRSMHPATHPPRDADRLLVVMSDIEMGPGGLADDFPQSDWLGELLLSYNEPPFDRYPVDLVFNGDTFDFLKTSLDGDHPHLVDAQVGLAKFRLVEACHGGFFDALSELLSSNGPPRRAWFVVGNHDPELLFSEVQAAIRRRIGSPSRVHFPGFSMELGDVHIEHGNQADQTFVMNAKEPFMELDGRRVLALPWGTVALLDVAMELHPVLYHLDRLKPRKRVFELMPEVKELLVGRYWSYWTREFWRSLRQDPLKRVSWTLFKQVVYRFSSMDPAMHVSRTYRDQLLGGDARHRVVVIGHEHHPLWWSHGDRKVLRTGCFRNEFMLDEYGGGQEPIPNTWAEIWLGGGQAIRSHLLEIEAPPTPEGYVPDSIFHVLPEVRRLLEDHGDRPGMSAAVEEQEEREATGPEDTE